jgi:hypothetical protein
MQSYLKGLTALHTANMQASDSRALGRTVRREPITTEHPLIRTNPVTGWNSLFFNPGFVTKIVGIPKTESDAIIRYLTEVVATTQEAHARFQWGENDVALWDNRTTVSDAQIFSIVIPCDFSDRITPLLMAFLPTVVMLSESPATLNAPTSTPKANPRRRSIMLTITYHP